MLYDVVIVLHDVVDRVSDETSGTLMAGPALSLAIRVEWLLLDSDVATAALTEVVLVGKMTWLTVWLLLTVLVCK